MMVAKYDPEFHHRRSIRLPNYDYSRSGAYFVTVCTQGRHCLFRDVVDGKVVLNSCGDIVQACWDDLPNHYEQVTLDAFVVMPNHVHGLILISDAIVVVVGAGFKPAPTKPAPTRRHGLPEIVRAFKTFSSRRINELRGVSGAPVWQRNYYEHIVRHEEELQRIRQYVHENPFKWSEDPDNPSNL
ncbi:MAG TPA: transposase [Dehalococcoidia bacterium]|nr:transposase [Dehalococcoidia bacterium]